MKKSMGKTGIGKIAVGLAVCLGQAAATHGPDVGLHPGYSIMTIRPDSFKPAVTGMEFLPNGDLLVQTWRGTSGPSATDNSTGQDIPITGTRTGEGKLYRLTNVKGTDRAAITVTEVAAGFHDAMGLCVVGNDVYIGDVDRVLKLVDANGDGKYESSVEIGKIPSYHAWFEYAFGPVHKDGKLYMALAVGVQMSGWPVAQLGKDRSTVISFPIGGGAYSVVAEGLRAPDGIALGPNNDIFVTDNQGGYRPSSQFHQIVQDRFYGYAVEPKGPIQIKVAGKVTPPAIWTPHAEANESPTELALMKTGPYAGQFIYGDVGRGGIYRAFMEKVNGEYQGCVFAMSGGLEVGVHRVRTGANGEIYIGGLGNGGHSNQGWNGTTFGLQKLTPNGTAVFEILSARSRAKGMELEFTMPVGTEANLAANYAVQQWWYKPTAEYGGPKQETQNRVVKSVQVSPDRKKVFLEIDGLKTGQVVYIATNNIKSQEGAKTLWYPKTWYTLNAISPSLPFEPPVDVKAALDKAPAFRLKVERLSGALKVGLPDAGEYQVRLLDFRGRDVGGDVSATGSARISTQGIRSGLYLLRAEGAGKVLSSPVVF
ncbi:MAG: hypothetical protein JWP91_956 [Fibrobacteres bacterium]|nr:hypothetical protein [Fibrobacterota bacterium]